MTKEMLNQIENDYWEEKASPIDMTEVFDLANKALEQETNCSEKPTSSTTKNDLEVDCISRKAVLDELGKWDWQELYLPIHFKENIVDVLPSVTPQEPKPMVEIDLYSVIKQKYIEREVLDKIRAEIDKARFVDKDTRICKNALASGLEVALQIIDKYKGENEG